MKKEEFENGSEMKKQKMFIPRRIRGLMKRKEKLSKRILKSRSWEKNHRVLMEIEEIECEIDASYRKKRFEDEIKAKKKVKDNPAFFCTYAKKCSKSTTQLSSLVTKAGSAVTDPCTVNPEKSS